METINEIWKEVKDYEGYYEVSNFGKVRRCFTEKALKEQISNRGYCLVCLCRDNIKKTISVHKIVANAFIENPENKNTVNHIDFDKLNNHVSNLEWMTTKENINHAHDNGVYKSSDLRKRSVKRKHKDNSKCTSNNVGISYRSKGNYHRYVARIHYNGKRIHLGSYKNELDAVNAYQQKIKEYGITQLSEKNS